MAWHVVVLKNPDFTALGSAATRKGTFPVGDYGTSCLCCDKETETRMSFDPSARHSATAIALPVCKVCEPHLAKGNSEATVLLVLLGIGLLLVGLAWNNGEWLAVPGALAFATMGAVWWSGERQRAAMARSGHHNGLEVVAIPGLVSVRTSNPRFAKELRARNSELCQRDD